MIDAIRYDARIRFPMRALLFWMGIHLLSAFFGGTVRTLGIRTTLLAAALIALLAYLDLRLRRERIFLGNIGVSVRFILLSTSATVVASEALFALIAARVHG